MLLVGFIPAPNGEAFSLNLRNSQVCTPFVPARGSRTTPITRQCDHRRPVTTPVLASATSRSACRSQSYSECRGQLRLCLDNCCRLHSPSGEVRLPVREYYVARRYCRRVARRPVRRRRARGRPERVALVRRRQRSVVRARTRALYVRGPAPVSSRSRHRHGVRVGTQRPDESSAVRRQFND